MEGSDRQTPLRKDFLLEHLIQLMLLSTGTHLKVVQERLGHASIAITADTYSHVAPGIQKAAADAFAEAMDKAS